MKKTFITILLVYLIIYTVGFGFCLWVLPWPFVFAAFEQNLLDTAMAMLELAVIVIIIPTVFYFAYGINKELARNAKKQ